MQAGALVVLQQEVRPGQGSVIHHENACAARRCMVATLPTPTRRTAGDQARDEKAKSFSCASDAMFAEARGPYGQSGAEFEL